MSDDLAALMREAVGEHHAMLQMIELPVGRQHLLRAEPSSSS